jgi:hypothetical protein
MSLKTVARLNRGDDQFSIEVDEDILINDVDKTIAVKDVSFNFNEAGVLLSAVINFEHFM